MIIRERWEMKFPVSYALNCSLLQNVSRLTLISQENLQCLGLPSQSSDSQWKLSTGTFRELELYVQFFSGPSSKGGYHYSFDKLLRTE